MRRARPPSGGGPGEGKPWMGDRTRLLLLGVFSMFPACVFAIGAFTQLGMVSHNAEGVGLVLVIVGFLFAVSGSMSIYAALAAGGPPMLLLRLNKLLLRVFMSVLTLTLIAAVPLSVIATSMCLANVDGNLANGTFFDGGGEDGDSGGDADDSLEPVGGVCNAAPFAVFYLAVLAPLGMALLMSSWMHLYVIEVFCQREMPDDGGPGAGKCGRLLLWAFAWGVVFFNAAVLGMLVYLFMVARRVCERADEQTDSGGFYVNCRVAAVPLLYPFAVLIPLSGGLLLAASYLYHLSLHRVRLPIAGAAVVSAGGSASGGGDTYEDEMVGLRAGDTSVEIVSEL